MATKAADQDLIRVMAEEISYGAETAVERWMTQIDSALTDTQLTALRRLSAVHQTMQSYKLMTGKEQPN